LAQKGIFSYPVVTSTIHNATHQFLVVYHNGQRYAVDPTLGGEDIFMPLEEHQRLLGYTDLYPLCRFYYFESEIEEMLPFTLPEDLQNLPLP